MSGFPSDVNKEEWEEEQKVCLGFLVSSVFSF